MTGFDAGALFFKIQSVGKAIFVRDMAESSQAIEGVEKTSRKAATAAEQLGNAQDAVGRKAKAAKAGLDGQGKASEELERKTRRSTKATEEQGKASETAAQKTARLKREQAEAAKTAAEQSRAAEKLSAVLLTVGVSTAAMIGVAVAKNTEFDQAMSQVRAATMASISDQQRLGEAALEAGADTAYSAREAANAQEELAKAGMSVDAIVGGSLAGSLSLAAAGQLQVARSAEIMATSLIQFKLPAEEATHVADVLAAGAGKAQGGVEDMALALSYVGPVSAGLKISLEETAGAIAFLASQGILGEKAGTSLRGVIMSLTAPSQIAAKTMESYGIEIFDANGNMKSLADVSEILKQRLGGLTEAERSAALGRIFGNEQITAARILYDGGAAAIKEWTAAVDDSGYAADQAAIRQDNLAGDIEKLGGAFDTALIRTGSGANDVLRDMVQIVTALVDWYGELPSEVQSTALILGTATAAATLFAGAAVFLRGKFVELRNELKLVNGSMRVTAAVAGGVGIALTAVLGIVGALAMKHVEAQAKADSYADALKRGGEDATAAAREIAVANLQAANSFLWMEGDSAYDAAEKLGLSLELVTDAALGNKAALDEVNRTVQLGANGSEKRRQQLKDTGLSVVEYSDAVVTLNSGIKAENEARDRGIELIGQEKDAQDEATSSATTAADAYLVEADAVSELEGQLQELLTAFMEVNGINQDAVSANAAWRDSLAGIKDEVQAQKDAYEQANGSLRGFRLSLDEGTAAGSANASMLADVAADAQKAAAAQYEVDLATMSGSDAAAKYADTLASQRAAFEKSATGAGFAKDAVQDLADRVFSLPSQAEIDILANTGTATSAINQFIRDQSQKIITIGVRTYTKDAGGGLTVRDNSTGIIAKADGGHVKFYANGGENHEPQYARAGDWRVWAEPETGGEWYLPDSPAKRNRSLSLAADMLDGWGYQLTPKGANYFAQGGKTKNKVSDTVRGMQRDWERSQRRGENRAAGMGGNGFSLIDELLDVADQSTKRAAERLRKEAIRSEKQFRRLERAAESADKKVDSARDRLDRLRDAAASMASSVAGAVRRLFDVGALGTATTKTATTTRKVDGQNVTTLGGTTTAKPTPKTIIASVKVTAHAIKNFAIKLGKLEKKGYPPSLLAEVAALGVEEGTPVIDALLKATASEVKTISGYYSSINRYSDRAGEIVADDNYAKLISTAEKQLNDAKTNADAIRKQLSRETDRIIRVITTGLGKAKGHADGGPVFGPGSGTSDSIHRRLSNNEHIVTAAEVSGAGGHSEVAAVRDMWRRGLSVADMPVAMVTSGAGPAPQITIAPTFVNPIVKDVEKDAWKAGLLLSGMVMGGNL